MRYKNFYEAFASVMADDVSNDGEDANDVFLTVPQQRALLDLCGMRPVDFYYDDSADMNDDVHSRLGDEIFDSGPVYGSTSYAMWSIHTNGVVISTGGSSLNSAYSIYFLKT
jgi:hypothetical protein